MKFVAEITATDADGDTLAFSIDQHDSFVFEITGTRVIASPSVTVWKAQLGFKDEFIPDFERPRNADGEVVLGGDQSYWVVVSVSDGSGVSVHQEIRVNITKAGPEITFQDGSSTAEITLFEETQDVATITASGADNGDRVYSIGGIDSGFFEINQEGLLSFKDGFVPDFETLGVQLEYLLEVTVLDADSIDTQLITVTIADAPDEKVAGVQVEELSPTLNRIHWLFPQSADDVSGYDLRRSADGGTNYSDPWTIVGKTRIETTDFVGSEEVTDAGSYTYQVRTKVEADGLVNSGPWSDPVSSAITAASGGYVLKRPNMLQTLTATVENGGVKLAWKTDLSGYATIRTFLIHRQQGSGKLKKLGNPNGAFSPDILTYTDTPVYAGTYTYRVTASGFGGQRKTHVTLNVPVPTAPTPPTITTDPTTVSTSSLTIFGRGDRGATIKLFHRNANGFIVQITGATTTVGRQGNWMILSVPLDEGTNEITASATFGQGTASAKSDAVIITYVPLAAPSITISSATVTATAGNPITAVRIDARAGGAVDSYGIMPDIQNGLSFNTRNGRIFGTPSEIADFVTYTITATNATGSDTATVTITVDADTTSPDAPFISSTAIPPGANTDSFTLSGRAEANSIVELFRETASGASDSLGTTTATAGTWTIEVSLILGENTFTATATDAAGNESEASEAVTITYNTQLEIDDESDYPAATAAGDKIEIHFFERITIHNARPGDFTLSGAASGPTVTALEVERGLFGDSTALILTLSSKITKNEEGVELTYTQTLGRITGMGSFGVGDLANFANREVLTDPIDATAPEIVGTPITSTAGDTIIVTFNKEIVVSSNLPSSDFSVAKGTGDEAVTVSVTDLSVSGKDLILTLGSRIERGIDIVLSYTGIAGSIKVKDDSGSTALAGFTSILVTNASETFAKPIITTNPETVSTASFTLSGMAEADSIVELFRETDSGAGDSLGTTTATAGTWTIEVTLIEGDNAFTATAAADSDGTNKSDASNAVTITYNAPATRPDKPVINPAVGTTTNQRSIPISGMGTAGSTIQLSLAGAEITGATATVSAAGFWTIPAVSLNEGNNTITATATNSVGTSDASEAVIITLDTMPPAAPRITTEATTITDTASITIEGTSTAGTVIKLLNSDTIITDATATANGDGDWSITATLRNGTHPITATATDGVGNESPPSNPVTITVSTLRVTVEAGNADHASGDIIISSDLRFVVYFNQPVTGFGLSGIVASGTANGGSPAAMRLGLFMTTGGREGYEFFVRRGSSDGSVTVFIPANAAQDADGNGNIASNEFTLIFDTTPPAKPSITTPGTVVNTDSVILSGTAEAGASIALLRTPTKFSDTPTGTTDANGDWTITDVPLSGGANTITAIATDAVRHRSLESDAVIITRNTVAPDISITPVIVTATVGNSIEPITIDATAAGDVGTVVSYSIHPVIANGLSFNTATGTISGIPTAPADSITYTITASNTFGEDTATVTITVNSDMIQPDAPRITTDAIAVNMESFTLSGTAEANSIVELFRETDSGAGDSLGTTTTTGTGTGAWTIVVTLIEGANTITATATDASGNESEASEAVIITLDTMPPAAPSITTEATTITDTASITIEGTSTAGTDIKLLNSGTIITDATATANGDGDWSITATLRNGIHPITAQAVDGVGNESPSSNPVTITVESLRVTITAVLDSLSNGDSTERTTVKLTASFDAVVTDFELSNIEVTGTANEGDPVVSGFLPFDNGRKYNFDVTRGSTDGSVTVSIRANVAQDANGNGNIASNKYTLIFDNTPPAAPIITTLSTITSSASIDISGTAEAGASIALLRTPTEFFDTPSGTADANDAWTRDDVPLILGENTFTATATDAVGNISTPSTTVIITYKLPDTAPRFGAATVADQIYTVGEGITDLTLPGASGGNGVLTYTLTPTDLPEGLTFDVVTRTLSGTPTTPTSVTTLTYTAHDNDENTEASDTASLTFTITVDAAPVIAPSGFTLSLQEDGQPLTNHQLTSSSEFSFTASATVTLVGGVFTTDTVVPIVATDSEAMKTLRFQIDPFSITIPAGQTSASKAFRVDTPYIIAPSDAAYGDETITLTATLPETTSPITAPASASFKLTDDNDILLTIVTAAVLVTEGDTDTVSVDIEMKTGVSQRGLTEIHDTFVRQLLSVDYTFSFSGTASAEDVVTSLTGTLVIPASNPPTAAPTRTFTLPAIVGDRLGEVDEQFTITFSNPRLTTTGARINGRNTVVVTIVDDDAPRITARVSSLTAIVGTAITPITIILSGGTVDSYSIAPSLPAGLSFDTTTGTLSGIPSATATATAYIITATNADRSDMATVTITVDADTTAPTAPIITTEAQTVNTASFTLAGTAEVNSVVELFRGTTSLGTTTATATAGAWSIGVTLIEGANTFTATATDGSANASEASTAVTITLDSDAPSVTIVPSFSSFVDGSTINRNSLKFRVTFGDDVIGFVATDIVASGTANGDQNPVVSDFKGFVSPNIYDFHVNRGSTDGSVTLSIPAGAAQAENGGNDNIASNEFTFTFDTTAPNAPIITSTDTTVITNSFPLSGSAEAGASIVLNRTVRGVINTPTGTTANGNGDWTIDVTLSEGENGFTATATDAAGNVSSRSTAVTITYTVPEKPSITASVSSLTAIVGAAITDVTIANRGGTASYSIEPVLPAGLSLSTTTGTATISGTPTAMTTATAHIITATNAGGEDTATVTITVNAAAVTVTAPSITASVSSLTATVDTAITDVTIANRGSTASYSIEPVLPAGLSLSTTTGTISGIPTAPADSITYTITATNAGGEDTVTVTITVDAAPINAPDISISPATVTATVGTAITPITIDATAGGAVDSYSIDPALPAGLSLSTTTGTISGIPTATAASREYIITATNAGGEDTVTVTITVNAAATGLNAEQVKNLNKVILPRLVQSMLASTTSAVSNRMGAAFSATPQTASLSLDGQTVQLDSPTRLSTNLKDTLQQKLPTYIQSLKDETMDWKQMLGNSSFVMPLNAGLNATGNGSGSSGSGATVWGGGDYTNMGGDEDGVDWKGEVFSLQLGVDQRVRDDLLAGGLVSWSKGDVDYTQAGKDGKYTHQITSIHPYMARSSDDVDLWGSIGYGQGKLAIKQDRDTKRSSDTRLLSLSAGVTGRLSQSGQTGLNLKSDIALAQIDIAGSGNGSANNVITADKLASQRLRLLLEVTKERRSASGVFKPMMEIGVRYDGGAGKSGVGAVLGLGLHYANTTGLTVEGKVHTLVGRDDYEEWGVSGVIRQQTSIHGQGLSFSLSPSYGNSDSTADRLWNQKLSADGDNKKGNGNGNAPDYTAQLDVNLGYGLFMGSGLLTPYSEVSVGDSKRYRLGLRWKPNSPFNLHLYGERKASSGADDSNQIQLESRIRF